MNRSAGIRRAPDAKPAPIDADVTAGINAAIPYPMVEPKEKGGPSMAHETAQQEYKQLTREELEKLAGEPLPERAAMSLINANVAAPVNAALALNVLSDDSTAIAIAEQDADIDQSN
jgi:hypothetical protein